MDDYLITLGIGEPASIPYFLTLGLGGYADYAPPSCRIYTAPAEVRTFTAPAETRTLTVTCT